ncbi:MAG: beta-N-acetylhexosaminidase [Rhizobiaceae bacterium]|nr:beta-N-acetylhexosaminidase [Rhizobiaceae bacterium]MCV0409128.1 beta-N-acetylhexosaminidase [Rhizobiaceae bacterium]
MSESPSKAMILGTSGTTLGADEVAFFRDERPWGFILFARNVRSRSQLRDLTASMREAVGRPDAPIFVDQEGGRVQRLRPPLAANYPPAAAIGALYGRDARAGLRAAWLQGRLHAFDLADCGFSADCLPVLDVPAPGAHDVIGDRAYAREPEAVAALGGAVIEGLLAGGIAPVIKHIPGHGRAAADTHFALPTVDASLEDLRRRDFAPFAELAGCAMAMTAHVVFSAIDPSGPATTSAKVVADIIRGEIGFDGLLMSDDVSMKALSGDFTARARAILASGVDLVLHCNGALDEMKAVASAVGTLQGRSLERARAALAPIGRADRTDETAARNEFAGFFEAAA